MLSHIFKGPEVEIVETASYANRTYLFVGNQRTSSIIVYSIGDDVTTPEFELIYRAGDTNSTWTELYQQKRIGDTNPQELM